MKLRYRGKYNGKPIQGFSVKFSLHVMDWWWKPIFFWNYGEPYFIWLCFTFRGYPEYKS